MFLGSSPTRVDEKGRLKMPADFKRDMAEEQEFYITSLDGQKVQLYPMPEWMKQQEKIAKMPATHPARIRFLDVTSYYGQVTKMDAQGRLLLPQLLREAAKTTGEVVVLGKLDILEVVNHEMFKPKVVPMTDAEMLAISEYAG